MILPNTINLVIAGGPSPGLLMSAAAVARELQALQPRVRPVFVGTGERDESRQISAAGFDYRLLGSPAGSPGLRWWTAWQKRIEARRLLLQSRPAAVLAMGGEVGEAVGRSAADLGIPLAVFEPQPVASPATRRLAPRAQAVFLGFREAGGELAVQGSLHATGVPTTGRIRPAAGPDPTELRTAGGLQRLIVLADEEDAEPLNEVLPGAFASLREQLCGWRIVHHATASATRSLRQAYFQLGLDAVATTHVHNLHTLLSRADLVIAGSAAQAWGDLTAAAVPAVLAASGQSGQGRHFLAEVLRHGGGCAVVDEPLSAGNWVHVLDPLLADPHRRRAMASAAQRCCPPDAAWQIATRIRDLL